MTAYTMFRCFLATGLLLVGCGDDPSNGTPAENDAGTGGALTGDAGAGGTGGHAAGGSGGAAVADGGGTGGAVATGAGGAGSGGAIGSGGAQGSGGSIGSGGAVGTGGAGGSSAVEACVDPMGFKVQGGLTCDKAKNGRECVTNCTSVRPNGQNASYIGPPMHAECWFGSFICVASCGECS